MRKFLSLLVLAGVAMMLTSAMYADTIKGDIGFTGTYVQTGGTSGDLSTATSFSVTSVSVNSTNGDFVGAGTPNFASPIGVNGNPPSVTGSYLWVVTVGSYQYGLLVSTENQTFTSKTQLNLAGTGTIYSNDPTKSPSSGTWQIGFGVSGASFTYQATSVATPEPAGMMLLGSGLLGLGGLFRRRIRR
jgi:hypothetical protein